MVKTGEKPDYSGRGLIEIIKGLVGMPFRFYRAERMRNQQADALAARTDLTQHDLPEITALAKGGTYNTGRAVRMVELLQDVMLTELSKPYHS